jgi:hypothetical protein
MNRKGHRETLVARQPGNRNAATHGAYSKQLKAPRVAQVLEELRLEHPDEPLANLRALAELYVTAERLSEWVAARPDGGISTSGKIAPALLEARKAWECYLARARELGITRRGRRELAGLPEERQATTRLSRHLRGEDAA